MMSEERRRSPRLVSYTAEFAGLPAALSVQVLDISEGGVLLQSSRPVDVGLRGPLRLTIGGESLTTEVAVVRVSQATSGVAGTYCIGAKFVAIKPEERHIIERLTR
jgi:hypothetical protein